MPDWCDLPPLNPPARLLADKNLSAFRLQFLIRMLFGCLTDADDRETAAFYREVEGGSPDQRNRSLTDEHRDAFDAHMAKFDGTGPIDDLRRRILGHARAQAEAAPGLFTLTVPTGGGKTLISLGFGLDHAARRGLRRLSLALDLMEELRAAFADRAALSLVNRRQITGRDVDRQETGAVLLTEAGRKTVLQAYHDRKRVELRHAFVAERLPLGLVPQLQAQLLARHLRGDLDGYPAWIW